MVLRAYERTPSPTSLCVCGHTYENHADYDCDCVGDPPRFVRLKQPCVVCADKNDCDDFEDVED